jgi:hypothetical protein
MMGALCSWGAAQVVLQMVKIQCSPNTLKKTLWHLQWQQQRQRQLPVQMRLPLLLKMFLTNAIQMVWQTGQQQQQQQMFMHQLCSQMRLVHATLQYKDTP